MAWFSSKRNDPLRTITGIGPPLLAGRYQVGRRVGRGAISQVYEALDMRTGGTVAVKFIPLGADASPAERQAWQRRLFREAEVSRRLRHPDIIAVLDAGITPQQGWLVMERVNGADLTRYNQRGRLLPEPVVLRLAARLAAALGHAHAQGVVHRDLKPANVLVDLVGGAVKLVDFGLVQAEGSAALTQTGMTLGTPVYMAPEVLAGAPHTPASDTYALGVLVYELLCGRRPYDAPTLGELLTQIASQPPAPLASHRPDLPASVVSHVEALMARDPAARPARLQDWAVDTAALAALLARILTPDVPIRI